MLSIISNIAIVIFILKSLAYNYIVFAFTRFTTQQKHFLFNTKLSKKYSILHQSSLKELLKDVNNSLYKNFNAIDSIYNKYLLQLNDKYPMIKFPLKDIQWDISKRIHGNSLILSYLHPNQTTTFKQTELLIKNQLQSLLNINKGFSSYSIILYHDDDIQLMKYPFLFPIETMKANTNPIFSNEMSLSYESTLLTPTIPSIKVQQFINNFKKGLRQELEVFQQENIPKYLKSINVTISMKQKNSYTTSLFRQSMQRLEACKDNVNINYPLLIHSAMLFSQATYNLHLNTESYNKDNKLHDIQRGIQLSRQAIGCPTYTNNDIIHIESFSSDKACGIITFDKRNNLIILSFRGTKDPNDIITDISFTSAKFLNQDIEVHSGFLQAFESISSQINQLLLHFSPINNSKKPILLCVGQSMGGALASLASLYYSQQFSTYLIHIGSPAIGNPAFVKALTTKVHPFGGIRIWNDLDVVPILALFVGYEHAGIPIQLQVTSHMKEAFYSSCQLLVPLNIRFNTNSNDDNPLGVIPMSSIELICPHILYALGSMMYVFPVFGFNMTKTK